MAQERNDPPRPHQGPLGVDSPAWSAGAIGGVGGVAITAFGVYLLVASSMSTVLSVAVIIFGVVEAVVSAFTLRRNRAAWAFAMSTNATAFVVTLFGAPKIRDAAEIAIAPALVPCLVFGVLSLLLILAADEF